ncbi:hypothetical protein GYB22_04625 [bacterium]|nr:hypothetical protein [bacterium]
MHKVEDITIEELQEDLVSLDMKYTNGRIEFQEKKRNEIIQIDMSAVSLVKIEDGQTPITKIILFWLVRILTHNSYSESSLWQSKLEYRYDKDLVFELKDRTAYRKLLKDVDFTMAYRVLKKLNALIVREDDE